MIPCCIEFCPRQDCLDQVLAEIRQERNHSSDCDELIVRVYERNLGHDGLVWSNEDFKLMFDCLIDEFKTCDITSIEMRIHTRSDIQDVMMEQFSRYIQLQYHHTSKHLDADGDNRSTRTCRRLKQLEITTSSFRHNLFNDLIPVGIESLRCYLMPPSPIPLDFYLPLSHCVALQKLSLYIGTIDDSTNFSEVLKFIECLAAASPGTHSDDDQELDSLRLKHFALSMRHRDDEDEVAARPARLLLEQLTHMIGRNATLQSLIVDYDRLVVKDHTDELWDILATSLKTNTTLQRLILPFRFVEHAHTREPTQHAMLDV